ncbi:MAG: NAD(P)/FAD-dependent oxidoreductase [Bacteroidota bacterium]|nr:NAD(P)/FAD-dependent oxidoreductase [Bacteroidota bacterium]
MKPEYDVVIIGSGLGGLLCGAILGKEGMKVCVLEKYSRTGGCLQNFKRHGVIFDTGMHYTGGLAPGQNLYRYWDYLGIMKKMKIEKLDPNGFDRIVIKEKEYPLAQGFDNFIQQLLLCFPEAEGSLKQYISEILKISNAFPLYHFDLPDGNMEKPFVLSSAFDFFNLFNENPLLPAVLSGNQFLYDGNPDKTPLYIPALINHSLISSAWRWVDGSSQISDLLSGVILSAGGEILTNSEIHKIRKENQGLVADSKDGRSFYAKRIISDLHPGTTIRLLDPDLIRKAYSDRIMHLPLTSSSFALYIVLKENTFPYLNSNFHVFSDMEKSGDTEGWPSQYLLYTPPFSGNKGYAVSLIIMTRMKFTDVKKWGHTHTGHRGPEYMEFKEKHAEMLLDEVSRKFPGLRACIRSMEISTPLTWREYTGTPEGSMYGNARDYHDPFRTLIMPRTPLQGLYLTGQNVNIHGALGVTIASFMTCGEIIGMEYLLKKVKDVC